MDFVPRRRTVASYRQACLSAASVWNVIVGCDDVPPLLYLCSRVVIVHSSSVEDDVILVLTSLSLLCPYIATTKVGFNYSFVLIH